MSKFKIIRSKLKKKTLTLKLLFSEKWYVKSANKYLKFIGIDLEGKVKWIARDVKLDLSNPSMIHIGNETVITSGVIILVHDYSIECGLVAIGKQDPIYESKFMKPVFIGNNVFIGHNAFIKPGTKIGNNCIIGAGSVISGIIPDDSVVIGNPGKIIANTKEWAEKKLQNSQILKGNKRKE